MSSSLSPLSSSFSSYIRSTKLLFISLIFTAVGFVGLNLYLGPKIPIDILDKQFGYQVEDAKKSLSTLTAEQVEYYKFAYNSGLDIIFPISIAVDFMIVLAKLYMHNKLVNIIQCLPLMFMFSDLTENYYIYNTLLLYPTDSSTNHQLIDYYLSTGSLFTISKYIWFIICILFVIVGVSPINRSREEAKQKRFQQMTKLA